jgi:hypothetical protein
MTPAPVALRARPNTAMDEAYGLTVHSQHSYLSNDVDTLR